MFCASGGMAVGRVDVAELVFSQYGKVKRVKIYRDDAGQHKGDGLVTYTKPASVDLAVAKVRACAAGRSGVQSERLWCCCGFPCRDSVMPRGVNRHIFLREIQQEEAIEGYFPLCVQRAKRGT